MPAWPSAALQALVLTFLTGFPRYVRLILVSTEPARTAGSHAETVYVDSGEEFRRSHAAAYPDGDTPTTIFGCAAWALDHIFAWGGSAYLPERLAGPHLDSGDLFPIADMPEFRRSVHLVVDKRVSAQWPWLDEMVARINAP